MSNRIKNNLKNLVGQTLNQYYSKVKPTISDLRYKQEYQNRIIECMVGEVDDNYITTPETDNPVVKLEHSKEGLVKVPTVKGKTILVDAEGNETDTPAEGCRLVSVGEQEDNKLIILSNNKNLFDGKKFLGNYITHTTHGIEMSYEDGGIRFKGTTNGEGSPTTRMISITKLLKEGYTYKIKSNSNIIHASFRCYLKDTNESQYTTVLNSYDSSLYNDVCIYLQYGNWQQSVVINELCKIHISVWDNVYTDHKSHKTEILLDEPLRNIEEGVTDTIDNKTVIRKIGQVTINGSEDIQLNNSNESRISYQLLVKGLSKLASRPCKCSHFIWSGNSNINLRINSGYSNLYFFIPNNDEFRRNTLEGFKQWLSENPIEVIYELEKPIIEELPNGISLQGFDDTTMCIENSITPTVSYGYNALIPYKEELSQQKEEVEINTLDIENNIIPYLMDMEFNLMTMEDK